MANVNLHRVTNFSLYLLFTAYYYLTQKLVDSCHFYTGICFFSILIKLNLNICRLL